MNDDRELLCGSLFSGVGGMDLGFTWAGWRHAFFAEIEPFGRAVLAARFPGVPIYSDVRDVPECGSGIPWGVTRSGESAHADARELDGDLRDPEPELRGDGAGRSGDQAGRRLLHADEGGRAWSGDDRLDVLTFGSPCQDLSVAGKRRGLDGDRSGLFWEAMRIAGDGPLRPRALLMENVEGLLSSNNGRDFALVLDAMAERGYRWSYRVLDSQHFGVPQRRRRVFVLAIADDDPRAERIAEVLALGEGGGGDSPTSDPSWPSAAAGAGAGAPGGRVVGCLSAQEPSHGQGDASQYITGDEVIAARVVGALSARGQGKYADQDLIGAGQLVTRDEVPRVTPTVTASYGGHGFAGSTQDDVTLAAVDALLADRHEEGDREVAGTLSARYSKGTNSTADDGALVIQHTGEPRRWVQSLSRIAHEAAASALSEAWDRLRESGRDPYQHEGEDFCGCDDCEVRVVLRAAEPYMTRDRERERERGAEVVNAITSTIQYGADDSTAQAGHLIVRKEES